MEYRREMDGLRALAVLPVILFHAGFQTFSGGYVGVDVFFVISGYLITSLILIEKQAGTFKLIDFYERRARRILPALFVVVFVCLPFAWFLLLPGDMKEFSDSVFAVPTFVSNIMFWRASGYFNSETELKPLIHTWSLAVEEQYYLLFPVFLLLIWSLGRRWILAILVFLAVVGLELAHWGSIAKPAAAFYLLPTRGWELVIGAFAAFQITSERKWQPNKTLSEIGGAIGLLLILYAIFAFDKQTPFPSLYTLLPTVGAALIILFSTRDTAVGKLLSNRIFVGVGLISYSAYLWHQPLFAFVRYRISDEPSTLLLGTLVVATALLAYFSWRYVETPFRNRQRVSRKQVVSYGLSLGAAFVVIGAVGHMTNGFLFRYDKEDQFLASIQKAEAGRYVEERFVDLAMKPFDPADNRKKILIVGDSYGQDLVNALYESGFADDLQIATREIGVRCGNLFIERDSFSSRIAPGDLPMCEGKGLFEDAELRQLMKSADEIWFASSWNRWQAALIEKSVANVEKYSMKPVKVFGTKNFGEIDLQELIELSQRQRLEKRGVVEPEVIETNALMKRALRPDVFVDIQELMCGADVNWCAQFSENGELVSYDGGHLTKLGARIYGDKLCGSKVLNKVLTRNGCGSASLKRLTALGSGLRHSPQIAGSQSAIQ
jgi:peptidoglycan/LPS O-acetylase OafA/YrhL